MSKKKRRSPEAFLAHYGVKGMSWGNSRTAEEIQAANKALRESDEYKKNKGDYEFEISNKPGAQSGSDVDAGTYGNGHGEDMTSGLDGFGNKKPLFNERTTIHSFGKTYTTERQGSVNKFIDKIFKETSKAVDTANKVVTAIGEPKTQRYNPDGSKKK